MAPDWLSGLCKIQHRESYPAILSTMRYFLIVLFLLSCLRGTLQPTYGLTDGRNSGYACGDCIKLLAEKPKEVLFGIHVNDLHEVFFSMSNRDWFDKIFTGNEDGVAVDLVSSDQYNCSTPPPSTSIPRGHLLKPVYNKALREGLSDIGNGGVIVKVGTLPEALYGKGLEGNLVLIKNGVICFYTWFTNIDRGLWDILDMGLYTDTLINNTGFSFEDKTGIYTNTFTYQRRFIIPFRAAEAVYDPDSMVVLNRALQLAGQKVKRIDIRAYSSIEGSAVLNTALQKKRADVMAKLMQRLVKNKVLTTVSTHENWLEFDDDLRNTPYSHLTRLSHPDVRKALLDRFLLLKLEKYLARHRKAVITLHIDRKTSVAATDGSAIINAFNSAITKKDIALAKALLQEVYERIADNSLPDNFISLPDIPRQKDFSGLLNDAVVYKYLLRLTDAEEALEKLRLIHTLDSANGRLNYNICALTLRQWRYDTGYIKPTLLLNNIQQLPSLGIPPSLVKRMLVNFHIIFSEYNMSRFNYAAKDSSVGFIRANYAGLKLSDDGLVSLAKYFEYYAQSGWAEEVLVRRAGEIDAREDLLFYFVTLRIIHPEMPITEMVTRAIHNASNINRKRFCGIFSSINKGGSSFQLLGYENLKAFYCERCNGDE